MIFVGIDASQRKWSEAFAQVIPVCAVMAGAVLATHLKSGRRPQILPSPLPWLMAVQASVLLAIGFVPSTIPHSFVTVPIAFLAATQIGLFRAVGDLGYLPVATTGTTRRLAETAYSALLDRKA